jgi:glutaredoxin
MRAPVLIILIAAATAVPAQQLYKWVDEKGRVQYTDTPPPNSAKKVEEKRMSSSPPSAAKGGEQSYTTQQAVKNFPVTLWVNSCGELCDAARNYLRRRNVPFTERNPAAENELDNFKKASNNSMEVPLLVIGTRPIRGFSQAEWEAALTDAGYPKPGGAAKPEPSTPGATGEAPAGK